MIKRIGWLVLFLAGCATNQEREFHTHIRFERTGDAVANRPLSGAQPGLSDTNTLLGVGGAALSPAENFQPAAASSGTTGAAGGSPAIVGGVGTGSGSPATGSSGNLGGGSIPPTGAAAGSRATLPASTDSSLTPITNRLSQPSSMRTNSPPTTP